MAEYEGVDALLAAITDEPLPEGARDDAGFMAEHRSATADVALLRERLGIIGDALADGTEATSPVPVPVPEPASLPVSGSVSLRAPRKRRFRPRVLAMGTLAVATVAAVVLGMSWLLAQGGGTMTSSSDDSGAKVEASEGSAPGAPDYLACSRLIVEGTVARIEPLPGTAQDRVTLDVSHYYKPDKGKNRITFLLDEDAYPSPHKGDHALVVIPHDQASPDVWATGEADIAAERAWILRALPEARDLSCE